MLRHWANVPSITLQQKRCTPDTSRRACSKRRPGVPAGRPAACGFSEERGDGCASRRMTLWGGRACADVWSTRRDGTALRWWRGPDPPGTINDLTTTTLVQRHGWWWCTHTRAHMQLRPGHDATGRPSYRLTLSPQANWEGREEFVPVPNFRDDAVWE